jgi:hypothetical protein
MMGKKQNLLTKLFAKNKSVKSTDHETGLPVQHRGKYQSKILMGDAYSLELGPTFCRSVFMLLVFFVVFVLVFATSFIGGGNWNTWSK